MTGTLTWGLGLLIGLQVVIPNFFGKCKIDKLLLGEFFPFITEVRRNECRSFDAKGLGRNVRFVDRVVCSQKVDVVKLLY